MMLQTQFLCSFTTNVQHSVLFFSPIPTVSIRSEKSSSESSEKSGVGFGSPIETAKIKKQKQPKGKRERASIIRRNPVEKPAFVSEQQVSNAKEQGKNESAFLLAWLGFGLVILVEGIALAASGFLPEEVDKVFVKYLYPSFTPTVFLFVAGAVAYGVFKYLQNEKASSEQK